MGPKVYVIIVNWNGWRDTVECLQSLLSSSYQNLNILLCDNGSSDGSIQRLFEWASSRALQIAWGNAESPEMPVANEETAQIVLFSIGSNRGFAGANNIGIQYALARDDFSFVWLLNNDTVIHPDALARLVERMGARPDAGMCGSTLLFYNRPERIQAMGGGYYCRWIGLPWHMGQLRRFSPRIKGERAERWMNYVVGASLLVSSSFLREIGLMCEEYFLYFEETDWALRSKGRYSLAYAPESIVYHKVGASIGTSSDPRKKSRICDYYSVRNRIYFTRKFFPTALPTIYLVLVAAMVMRLLFGQWERAAMIGRLMISGGRGAERPGQTE